MMKSNTCKCKAPSEVKIAEIDLVKLRELRTRARRMQIQQVESTRSYGLGIEDALKTLGLIETGVCCNKTKKP